MFFLIFFVFTLNDLMQAEIERERDYKIIASQ